MNMFLQEKKVINESLVDKEETELFHLIDHNSLPKMQESDPYQDPIGGSEEGEQSSDHRLESLYNKFEDLPMDEIVIKESSIMAKKLKWLVQEPPSCIQEALQRRCRTMAMAIKGATSIRADIHDRSPFRFTASRIKHKIRREL
ncbi:hypothetical protein Ancab_009914 [Ancistrocladus abbreviatus]